MPRDLHVGLNALFLDPGVSGGVDTYLHGLAPALAAAHPGLRLTVFTTRRGGAALRAAGWHDLARIVRFPFDEGQRERRLFAEQVAVNLAARRRGVDVLHSLASTGPVRPAVRSVVTVHDVTFLRIPTFGRVTTLAMRTVVTGAARSADVLIAVSATARDEIAAQLRIPAERFDVIPHGAGRAAVVAPVDPAAVRRRLGLDGRRVILCLAAIRPHKNQQLLVEALPRLPEDVALVLAGVHELGAEALLPRARELGVADRVALPGFLPDAEIEALWREAACAAFPTRGEGFGLPVLEAMRRGVPVACSDIAVLREVGGSVPHYFSPDDAEQAAGAIAAAMADTSAPARGREQAGRFSWEATARRTLAAYERAVS